MFDFDAFDKLCFDEICDALVWLMVLLVPVLIGLAAMASKAAGQP
jgi:hypothetical protein